TATPKANARSFAPTSGPQDNKVSFTLRQSCRPEAVFAEGPCGWLVPVGCVLATRVKHRILRPTRALRMAMGRATATPTATATPKANGRSFGPTTGPQDDNGRHRALR